MKTFLLFMLFCQSCFSQRINRNKTVQANTNNAYTYLRIGDSNESGGTATQDGSFPAKFNSVYKNTLVYFKPDRTSTDNGVWYNYSDSNPTINRESGYGAITSLSPPFGVGPDISFAYACDSFFKTKVSIIKCALGGTKLLSEWVKTSGSMYNFFVPYSYTPGIPKLIAARYGRTTIKALIVRLGTNDCATGYNDANFKAGLQSFVTNIRSDLGLPNLKIYWVQVNANLYLEPGGLHTLANVNAARAAITACATPADPAFISNFFVLNYDSDTLLADGLHYDQNSCIRQGRYEAALMFNL